MARQTIQEYVKGLENQSEVIERAKIEPTEIEKKVNDLAQKIARVYALGINQEPARIIALISELIASSGLTERMPKEDLEKMLMPKVQKELNKLAGKEE